MPATPPTAPSLTNSGRAVAPLSVATDPDGNLLLAAGTVINRGSLMSTTWPIGSGGVGVAGPAGIGDYHELVGGGGADFIGGSGVNLQITCPELSDWLPFGRLRPISPTEWVPVAGDGGLRLIWNLANGSAQLVDATDVVATLPTGSPVPRAGTLTATPYGEDEYNLGSPFTAALSYDGAADSFPRRPALLTAPGTTLQTGIYDRTGWSEWTHQDFPAWQILLDGTGAGEITDGVDVVAERAADPSRLYDPTSGDWISTPYGAATYGSPMPRYTATASAGTWPTQDYAFAGLLPDGTSQLYLGETDPTKFLVWEAPYGTAYVGDAGTDLDAGTGEVAHGAVASTSGFTGTYPSEPAARTAYNGGAAFDIVVTAATTGVAFTAAVGLQRAVPQDGHLYVRFALDGANEITGVDPPEFATVLPSNGAGQHFEPLATVSGGVVTPHHCGAISWHPPQPGPAGTGLAWVSLTQAAYAALGTPDPDTIYDITDWP